MPTNKTRLCAISIALWVVFSQIHCVSECEGKLNPLFEQSNWQLIAVDNSGKKPVPLTTNKAPMNAFGLGILYTTYISDYEHNLKCGFEPELSSHGNRVTDVLITCLQDFAPSHPAGVSLNSYFNSITKTPYKENLTVNFNKYSETTREVDFIMVQPPDHPGNYQFNVRLFFNSSSKSDSIYTTPVITLY